MKPRRGRARLCDESGADWPHSEETPTVRELIHAAEPEEAGRPQSEHTRCRSVRRLDTGGPGVCSEGLLSAPGGSALGLHLLYVLRFTAVDGFTFDDNANKRVPWSL